MAKIPTIKVEVGDDGGYMVINVSDFDPKKYKAWSPPPDPTPEPPPDPTPEPEQPQSAPVKEADDDDGDD